MNKKGERIGLKTRKKTWKEKQGKERQIGKRNQAVGMSALTTKHSLVNRDQEAGRESRIAQGRGGMTGKEIHSNKKKKHMGVTVLPPCPAKIITMG